MRLIDFISLEPQKGEKEIIHEIYELNGSLSSIYKCFFNPSDKKVGANVFGESSIVFNIRRMKTHITNIDVLFNQFPNLKRRFFRESDFVAIKDMADLFENLNSITELNRDVKTMNSLKGLKGNFYFKTEFDDSEIFFLKTILREKDEAEITKMEKLIEEKGNDINTTELEFYKFCIEDARFSIEHDYEYLDISRLEDDSSWTDTEIDFDDELDGDFCEACQEQPCQCSDPF